MPVEKKQGSHSSLIADATVLKSFEGEERFVLGRVDSVQEFKQIHEQDYGPLPESFKKGGVLRFEKSKVFTIYFPAQIRCCSTWFDVDARRISTCPVCKEKYNFLGETYDEYYEKKSQPTYLDSFFTRNDMWR